MSASQAARLAAEGAGRAAQAAAENAAKAGISSSEFKTTALAIGIAGLIGGLKVFTLIPGPWQIPAAVVLAMAIASGAYAQGRSKVKVASLELAGSIIASSAAETFVIPQDPRAGDETSA